MSFDPSSPQATAAESRLPGWLRCFAPAPHRPRRPDAEVARVYPRMRARVLSSTFFGYAIFYIVRNNFSPVAKELGEALQYDKSMLGTIVAGTSLAYGVGKLVLGTVSDRSNPRLFMPLALLLTAALNLLFAFSTSFPVHVFLWTLNGFVQGGGWGPCGRSIGHWFSLHERGAVFAVWNCAHNVGGAIAGILAAYVAKQFGWASAFYVPAALAVISAAVIYFGLVDTPQSEGLPAIEEFKNDHPDVDADDHENHEVELSTAELFSKYIVKNRMLWIFAFANFFVYIVRYSMLTWGPQYLKEVKHATMMDGGASTMYLELAGIPSTLLIGWLSDKLSGRRGMVSFLCMIPIFFAFLGIMLNPPGNLWLDMILMGVVGFFVYPPVMLLGVAALDLTSKKAVGTAAGFVGLFGYLGNSAQAQVLGYLAQHYDWNFAFCAILACNVMAIVLLALTWKVKPHA